MSSIVEFYRGLVAIAHPDNQVLGRGDTIACNADAADQVQVLIGTEGASLPIEETQRLSGQ